MSRYPGTQFKVYDNSQATAIVPVASGNSSDAVSYMSAFRSVKGPEKITSSYGQEFYDLYGTQDNVKFSKYGQPLFQTSMNINNGANIIGKRAVLDDATLGNTTVALRVTKYKVAAITRGTGASSDDAEGTDVITKITAATDANPAYKYSIAPLMFSVDNKKKNQLAVDSAIIQEYKERYNLYKDYIYDTVDNSTSKDDAFLNALVVDGGKSIPSGFAISSYYDEDGNVIEDITKVSKDTIRTISSMCTGSFATPKTISAHYDVEDIVENTDSKIGTVDSSEAIKDQAYGKFTIKSVVKYTLTETKSGDTSTWSWVANTDSEKKEVVEVTFKEIYSEAVAITQIVNASIIPTSDVYTTEEAGLINGHAEVYGFTYSMVDDSTDADVLNSFDITTNYSNSSRLRNDLMITAAYVEEGTMVEYIYPMFTIFDNGRGESTKSISLEFDANTSKTLKKAVYKLNVYNYKTSKRLESFYFTLNPYEINPSTGYSFDIESAVNNVSEQIIVKTYYKSYDAFSELLQNVLQSTSETLVSDNDVLFGHLLTGSFPTFSSYTINNLRALAYTYNYADLNVFGNDVITVNAFCDEDNMSDVTAANVRYYYYNYLRVKSAIYERLEYGSDGYDLARTDDSTQGKGTTNYVYVILDATNDADIINESGLPAETCIQDADLVPEVPSNFISYKVTGYTATLKLKDAAEETTTIYLTDKEFDGVLKYEYIDPNTEKKTIHKLTKVGSTTSLKDDTYCIVGAEKTKITVYIPYAEDKVYEEQYRRFYSGAFDRDIFNLDIYFPNAIFDANYSNATKLAIQRLVAYRGDLMAYMDMGIGNVNSYKDCEDLMPTLDNGLDLVENANNRYYVRDMHIAVTSLSYDMRNPYDNKVISVTGTYALSNLYINHFARNVAGVFAGISNGITISGIIDGTANYIPKIYPTDKMTSLDNIGGVYPSDDDTIMNEKQLMCDLRVNYGSYYDDRFCMDTEYTLNAEESEFSYWNNVALVCSMMQAIRKACPAARYQFITQDDLNVYETAVNTALTPWKSKFAKLTFTYVQDENALQNKIFYAAIEVVFKPFAQAEIFTITALNYSTLDSSVTSI